MKFLAVLAAALLAVSTPALAAATRPTTPAKLHRVVLPTDVRIATTSGSRPTPKS